MKKFISIIAVSLLALGACTSTGALDPNLGQRILADGECLGALAVAGVAVYTDPVNAGVATAVDVLHAVQASSADLHKSGVLGACKQTLSNAVQDAQGIAAKAKKAPPAQ